MAGDEPPSEGTPEIFEPAALADLPAEVALSRLPGGRHGLPRSVVAGNQRVRIVAGMLQLLPRLGYQRVTIGDVTREAGVSRSAFYAQFEGKEECFLATYDLAGHWLCDRVQRASAGRQGWPDRVHSGVSAALGLLAANPALAHLLTVEAMQVGELSRERRQACLDRLAEALRAGRSGDVNLPEELEELLLGGVFFLIGRYIETGRTEQLTEAGDELIGYLLLPYLGPGEARRIVDRAA